MMAGLLFIVAATVVIMLALIQIWVNK